MTVVEQDETIDPFDIRLVQGVDGVLRDFNAAGVLAAADVHVALRLARLGPETDDAVLLAAALAVRAPRLGHVCAELRSIEDNVVVDVDFPPDLRGLPWPDLAPWLSRLAASPLVASDESPDRPLHLAGSRLYLDRYWRDERRVAADLAARSSDGADGVDVAVLSAGLRRLFPSETDADQRLAAATAVLRRFTVVGGGPGTGKTTTVAKTLALLAEQAEAGGAPPPLVGLAAPTGKAAARLAEAVHEQAAGAAISAGIRAHLEAAPAVTLHRLLGWRPGTNSRFRHDHTNRLPHDVVVVDETSMVSLSMMARLVEAVRPSARLILVGDPEQLLSVEAGAVLGDVVGPAAGGLRMRDAARAQLATATGQDVVAAEPPAGVTIGDGIVVLGTGRRYRPESGIAALAKAIQGGDADAVIEVLNRQLPDVTWISVDIADPAARTALQPVHHAALAAGRAVTGAARAGDGKRAIEALASFRLLCAHRRGPYGAATWTAHVERWLAAGIADFTAGAGAYAGRPLLVTKNDHGLQLFNGDTGVVISDANRLVAVFERDPMARFSLSRLSAVDTVYAMTVHKSQGSQFETVAVLLPDPSSRILTRELLHTGVTRARKRLILAGAEDTIRAAVDHQVARASGLRDLLWNAPRV